MSFLVLDKFKKAGVINALELHIAKAISRIYGEKDEMVLLAIALSNAALRLGHLGLKLSRVIDDFAPQRIVDYYEQQEDLLIHVQSVEVSPSWFPPMDIWLMRIKESNAIWHVDQPFSHRPMVLDGDFLFPYKSWKSESQIAHVILTLIKKRVLSLPNPQKYAQRLLGKRSDQGWFEEEHIGRSHLAVHRAIHQAFCIIQGGPGTGKTTITQRILGILIEQYHHKEMPLRIALAAPTGKAAARMTESIKSRQSFFDLPEEIYVLLDELQGMTIHKLLGLKGSHHKPIYDENHPLPYDVIIIDESSMIDSWLMSALLNAIDRNKEDPKQHLILLGDPYQLPPVGQGAPFDELCADYGQKITIDQLSDFQQNLKQLSKLINHCPYPIQDMDENQLLDLLDLERIPVTQAHHRLSAVVELNKVHRVGAQSGIHQFATMIKEIDRLGFEPIESLMKAQSQPNAPYQDIECIFSHAIPPKLLDILENHYINLVQLAKKDPKLALMHYKDYGLLSPHYGGATGVYAINDFIESSLKKQKLGGWNHRYIGRPILITKNDEATGLVNGDIGILGEGQMVYFEGVEEPVHLDLLPEHKTVYAMSVHKSQGSEFNHVVLILPHQSSPILNRELIYTAITRAKKKVYLIGGIDQFRQAMLTQGEKSSHLNHFFNGST
jgi:exodeoxyribonuclease V alpha subunit